MKWCSFGNNYNCRYQTFVMIWKFLVIKLRLRLFNWCTNSKQCHRLWANSKSITSYTLTIDLLVDRQCPDDTEIQWHVTCDVWRVTCDVTTHLWSRCVGSSEDYSYRAIVSHCAVRAYSKNVIDMYWSILLLGTLRNVTQNNIWNLK